MTRISALLLLSLVLLGCGNKGPLYLPEKPNAPEKTAPEQPAENN